MDRCRVFVSLFQTYCYFVLCMTIQSVSAMIPLRWCSPAPLLPQWYLRLRDLIRIDVCIVYTFPPTRVSSRGHRTTRILCTRLHLELLAYFVRGCTQNYSHTLYEAALRTTRILCTRLHLELLAHFVRGCT